MPSTLRLVPGCLAATLLMLLACSGAEDPPAECEPATCSGLDYECGIHDDECGDTIGCGTCADGYDCVDGSCVSGQCVSDTCENLGVECGSHADGCDDTLDCGTCGGQNEECRDGVCVCVAVTCENLVRECGSWSDGCGGTVTCGTCDGDDVCDEDAGRCVEACTLCGTCRPLEALQGHGGWCGDTLDCNPETTPGSWPGCLNAQCSPQYANGPGQCSVTNFREFSAAGYCLTQCSTDDDCRTEPDGSLVEGPAGASFRCLGTYNLGFCFPGSLSECSAESDCGDEESCQISFSADYQHFRGRCLTDTRCGAAPGEACNSDVTAGELVSCRNGLCLLGTCTQLCADAQHCTWSPELTCRADVALLSSSPSDLFSICAGRVCNQDEECGNTEAFWCNPEDPLDPGGESGFCDRR